MKVSEAVAEKAIRYVIEGRIRPEIEGAPIQSYIVDGENGRYRTVVGPSWTMCDCPATTPCSHRHGAKLLADLRRSDPVRYAQVRTRILDRRSRLIEPIQPEDLVPTGKNERPEERWS